MLTELQERVARIITELPEARGFALAGGAALVVHGLTERSTNDLDYFTTAPADVPTLRRAIEIAMAEAGFTVTAVTASEEFVRLEVRDGTGDTRIDLAWDARMRPPVATDFGTVLHEDELAADKLLAVFGRAEARDFLDVYGFVPAPGMGTAPRACEAEGCRRQPGAPRRVFRPYRPLRPERLRYRRHRL